MTKALLKTIPPLSKYAANEIKLQKLAGLTNSNYLIDLLTSTKDKKYILRIPKQKTNQFINRNNETVNAEIAQQLGIAPKCLWRGEGDQEGMSLSEFIDNAEYPDGEDKNTVSSVAKTLAKLHNSHIKFDGVLDNKSIATKLTQYFELCSAEQQNLLKSDYQKSLSLLETQLDTRPKVPSHVDLITENILQQGDKIWFIDWEYSAMASPFWDVAIFCNSAEFDAKKSEKILKQVLMDYQDIDFQTLKQYQFITKVVSDCWRIAFEHSPK